MKQITLLIALTAILFTACDNRKKSKEAWLSISPLPPKSELPYFLMIDEGNNIQIDTLQIGENKVSLQLLPDSVGIGYLYNRKNELICAFYAHESARIHLKKEGSNHRFQGDSINQLLFDYYTTVQPLRTAKAKAMQLAEAQLKKGTKDSIWKIISDPKLYQQDSLYRIKTKQFIEQNATLPTALIALDQYNQQSIYTPADPSWLALLTQELLNSKAFVPQIAAIQNLSRLSNGATLNFSSFVDLYNKPYTEPKEKRKRLVCFWDHEDSISVVAHKEYASKFAGKNKKGYDYIGVSLNGNAETLEKCINKEKIAGVQLLTSGANTKAKRGEYGIASTPYFVLLDTNSVVISAGLFPIMRNESLK